MFDHLYRKRGHHSKRPPYLVHSKELDICPNQSQTKFLKFCVTCVWAYAQDSFIIDQKRQTSNILRICGNSWTSLCFWKMCMHFVHFDHLYRKRGHHWNAQSEMHKWNLCHKSIVNEIICFFCELCPGVCPGFRYNRHKMQHSFVAILGYSCVFEKWVYVLSVSINCTGNVGIIQRYHQIWIIRKSSLFATNQCSTKFLRICATCIRSFDIYTENHGKLEFAWNVHCGNSYFEVDGV